MVLTLVKTELFCYEPNEISKSIKFPLFQHALNDTISIPLNDINCGKLRIDLIDKLFIAIGEMQNDLMAIDKCKVQLEQMNAGYVIYKLPAFLVDELRSVVNFLADEKRKFNETLTNFFNSRNIHDEDTDHLSEVRTSKQLISSKKSKFFFSSKREAQNYRKYYQK